MLNSLAKWLRRRPGLLRPDDAAQRSVELSARDVFSDVYRRKAWFSPTADRELYSGPGSDAEFAASSCRGGGAGRRRTDLVSALRYDRPPFGQQHVELFLEIPAATRMLPQSTIKTFLISNP